MSRSHVGERAPVVTWLLAAGIVGVAWFGTGLVPTGASLQPYLWGRSELAAGRWDKLLLSMFAHGGVLHMAFNLIGLLSFGALVERSFGRAKFLGLYLASGAAGGMAHVWYGPDIPVVGASGAIFGLMGLILVLRPRLEIALFSLIPMPIVLFGAGYAALLPVLAGTTDVVPIAHEAHVGGMVAGALVAVAFDPGRAVRVLPAAYAVFVLVAVAVDGLMGGEDNPWFYAWIVLFLLAAFAYLRWLDARLTEVVCHACDGAYAVHRRMAEGSVTRTRCPHCRTRGELPAGGAA